MSSSRFSDSAVRLAGMSGALFGWSPEAFWRATPAELEAVLIALAGPQDQALSRDELKTLMEANADG